MIYVAYCCIFPPMKMSVLRYEELFHLQNMFHSVQLLQLIFRRSYCFTLFTPFSDSLTRWILRFRIKSVKYAAIIAVSCSGFNIVILI